MGPRGIWAFASGSNSPGEIVGFARAGVPPGVAMLRLDRDTGRYRWACASRDATTPAPRACWLALRRTAKEIGVPVFVDTGAYTEFSAPGPIPAELWEGILADQVALARELGPLAVIVLPDKVLDQRETLRRLKRYRHQVGQILDAGALGIVAIQPGDMSGVEFANEVARVLGRKDWVLGFPAVRRRRTPEEVRRTLAGLPWLARGVHLLGIGPEAPAWPEYTAALASLPSSAWASSDTVVVRRLVSRPHVDKSGRKYELGPLTEQEDVAREQILEEAWGSISDPLVGVGIDPTEDLPEPSGWMPLTMSRAIARAGRETGQLTRAEAKVFAEDPTAGRLMVYERDAPGAEWWVDQEIEKAWWARLHMKVGALGWEMRKERARRALLGERAPTQEVVPRLRQMELAVV